MQAPALHTPHPDRRPDDAPGRGCEAAGGAPGSAARGIILALLLSAPVWFGIGVAIWQATVPAPGAEAGKTPAAAPQR